MVCGPLLRWLLLCPLSLFSPLRVRQIPSLNSLSATRDISHLRPNQLVRFRGMIQETFQPDFYAGLFQEQQQPLDANQKQPFSTVRTRTHSSSSARCVSSICAIAHCCSACSSCFVVAIQSLIRTGKYRDVLHVEATSDPSHECMMERLSINVVPIPGESDWVTEAWRKIEAQSGHSTATAPPPPAAQVASGAAPSAAKKRGLEASSADEDAQAAADASMTDESSASAPSAAAVSAAAASAEDISASTPQKKGKSDAACASSSAAEGSAALPAEHGLEVIVTLYDSLANPAAAATAAAAVTASASSSSSSAATPAAAATAAPRPALRVGEMFEFIGVLSLAPDLKSVLEDVDADMDGLGLGGEVWSRRRNQALRMHAMALRPVEPGFPFIADHLADKPAFETQKQQLLQVLPGVRASLLEYLTSLLSGDALAAEVLLLFLLQRLHTRGSGISGRSMIGKMVVNLVLPPSVAGETPAATATAAPLLAQSIHKALQNLMPRVAKIDVNIETLNAQTWQPKKSQLTRTNTGSTQTLRALRFVVRCSRARFFASFSSSLCASFPDYDDESLDSNLLHLSSPSLLLLDETCLSVGTLSGVGVVNLKVLSKLLAQSSLEYDFQFQTLDFPVEYAALILTAANKSIMNQDGQQAIDVTIKVQPSASASASASAAASAPPAPTSEQLDYWRAYLLMSRANSFQIAPALSHQIEEHFVALRKARPTVTNETTLHRILNIARSVATQARTRTAAHARERKRLTLPVACVVCQLVLSESR